MSDEGKKLDAVVADVVFRFQTYPGTDDGAVIDLGDGKLEGSATPVRPQGKGFYSVKVPKDGELEFEVKGTRWRVLQRSAPENLGEDEERPLIVSWSKLGDKDIPRDHQQRLQILGYNPGPVDGAVGERTERAILGFQTDQKLRSDAIVGPSTKGEFKRIIESNAVHPEKAKDYVVRVCPIRFTRAPKIDPKVVAGPPELEAPEVDDRGFIEVSTMPGYPRLRGPVATVAEGQKLRVKVVREQLGKSAPLIASSSDPGAVKVATTGRLPSEREMLVEAEALAAGNAELRIQLDAPGSPVVLGALQVVVLKPLTVHVRPHYVTIAGTGPVETKAYFDAAFRVAERIWEPAGMKLRFRSWRDKSVALSVAGRISADASGDTKPEFDTALLQKDNAGREPETDAINLLLVAGIDGCNGITYDALDYNWPNGIALMHQTADAGSRKCGNDVAHEIGHYLALGDCLSPSKYVHAEDDPDAGHRKVDMWSIRRLMYSYNPTGESLAWRREVGYGSKRRGALVSVRNNPGDHTDKECETAWKRRRKAPFYKKP